jgi:beta-N-acetylhexosaminidase
MNPQDRDANNIIHAEKFSLDFKIGQMVMVGFRGTELRPDSPVVRSIRDLNLGGVWLTDNESPMGRTLGNIKSHDQLKALNTKLQQFAEIPLFIAIDGEGGKVILLKEKYGFPPTLSARTLGELNNPELTYSESLKIARLLKELKINFNFAPVVDLNLNPTHASLGVKERCFSDDYKNVIRHAQEVIRANHDSGIFCCIKHFPGHGSAKDDSHDGFVDVSETWQENELRVFSELIKKQKVEAILTAHILLKRFDSDFPATLSEKIINGVLRSELGFTGLVISDDMNMGAIKQNYTYEDAIERAIKAGIDIILQSNVIHYDEHIAERTIEIIKKLISNGRISKERIDISFKRILHLKENLI